MVIARALLAAAAGFGLSLAYEPTGWWWLAVPAVGVLVWVCLDRTPGKGFLLGLVFGAAFFLPLLAWVSPVIGRDAGIGLAVYSALWLGVTGAGIAVVGRLRWWWLAVPAVWVLVEAVSGRVPFGGWGWGRLGFSQADSPLLPWASVAGVPGLSFLVVLLACAGLAVGAALHARRLLSAAVPGAVFAAVLLGAAAIATPIEGQSAAGPASRAVALVQGDVPQAGLDFNAARREVLDNHVTQTLRLAQDAADGEVPAPDLVVWPENASDIDPYRNRDAAAAIEAAARAVAAPILVGAVVQDPDSAAHVRNQGIVWDPLEGPGDTYTKRNLVPFGEYVPFRSVLAAMISRFDRVPRDFLPGDAPGGLDIGGTRIGDAICFDVAYDDAMREAVRDGGRMLVVQTNNATYNGTAQPFQQFAMSRIRAVEHGRAVAVVATSGLSGVIAPDGSVVPGTTIGELEPGVVVTDIPQRDALTPADRWGAWPELLVCLLAVAAIVIGSRRGAVTTDTQRDGSNPVEREQRPV